MKVLKKLWGDAGLFALQGEFDAFCCPPFLGEVEALVAGGVAKLVLNMAKVSFIDSAAVGCILRCRKRLLAEKGDLAISEPSPLVREAVEGLGLTDYLKIHATDEDALSFFQVSDGLEMSEGSRILLHPLEGEAPPLVGRIRKLEEDRIVLEVLSPKWRMSSGMRVKLKFRLPLFQKSYYFDAEGAISETVHSVTGSVATIRFTQMQDEDRASITQFLKDMQYLRKEAGR